MKATHRSDTGLNEALRKSDARSRLKLAQKLLAAYTKMLAKADRYGYGPGSFDSPAKVRCIDANDIVADMNIENGGDLKDFIGIVSDSVYRKFFGKAVVMEIVANGFNIDFIEEV